MTNNFDRALTNLVGDVWTYQGNPPTTEEEYTSMEWVRFDGDKPTWSAIQTEISNLPNNDDIKASAKAKLIAGEALTEDEANTIVI